MMKRVGLLGLLLALTGVVHQAGSAPVLATEAVPFDDATPFVDADGTEVYCVFDIRRNDEGTIVGLQWTDCPAPLPLVMTFEQEPVDSPSPLQDPGTLDVGQSVTSYGFDGTSETTITLQEVEFAVPTSSKPDEGMTNLAARFTFEAGPGGGETRYIEAYDPNGRPYDQSWGGEGDYARTLPSDVIRPGKTVDGWVVFDVPSDSTVEVVTWVTDEHLRDVAATWVVDVPAAPVVDGPSSGLGKQSRSDMVVTITEVDWEVDYSGTPAEGNRYVAIHVVYEALQDDAFPGSWSVIDEEGFTHSPTFAGVEPMLDTWPLKREGNKTKGWVAFEVPAASTSLEFVESPFMADGDDLVWVATR